MWYRIPSIRTTSNVPTVSGDRSSTSISWSSTFESSARRARSNPSLVPQPPPPQQKESVARTRSAPRRSASNEKNPSHAPTSSTVLPERSSGRWIFGRRSELSSTPGVTMPSPSGIEWYQLTFAISV